MAPEPEASIEAADIKEKGAGIVDEKLEVIVIPVADVDRAKEFYGNLGWRLDADRAAGDSFRIVQLTPPGSECSIIFGEGVTSAEPGSVEGLHVPFSTALGCWAVEPALVDALAHSGAHVEPIDAGVTPHNEEIWGQVWAVFMVAYYGHLVAEHHERIDPAVLALIEAGQSMGAVELKRLEIERSDLWGRMAPIFRTHDVLLCPTMAIGPVPPGSPSGRRWGSWMRPATTAPR